MHIRSSSIARTSTWEAVLHAPLVRLYLVGHAILSPHRVRFGLELLSCSASYPFSLTVVTPARRFILRVCVRKHECTQPCIIHAACARAHTSQGQHVFTSIGGRGCQCTWRHIAAHDWCRVPARAYNDSTIIRPACPRPIGYVLRDGGVHGYHLL